MAGGALDGGLNEVYRGKNVLLTGGTGFVGTALVEKALRSLPDLGRLYLLVRPAGSKTAAERFDQDVLGSPAFGRLRECFGEDFDERVWSKLRIVAGDVHAPSAGLGEDDLAELSREVDVVIHSAASVVFDAPLDAALDSNVDGTLGMLGLARGWERSPLFVHVSTAYTAGKRSGLVEEETPGAYSPNGTPIDAASEVASLRRVVEEVERASREKGVTDRLRDEARRDVSDSSGETREKKAEELRLEWVRERLVERGNSRASELGWHDVYTFTKSLAERRVLAERGDLPVVILRPAIIESSHREPYPGWIQGTRMADPIIMAYGRGLLQEFPGDPESQVDVVPVDHVVNATLAVGALRPDTPEVFQVASGDRNPLKYREFYEHVRDYFTENPMRDSGGRPIQAPEWSFPGRRAVEGRLKAELIGLSLGNKLAARLPDGHLVADLRGRMTRAEKRARMNLYYSSIYGGYANVAAIFSTKRTISLYRRLNESDRQEFPFDITELHWGRWLRETHLPALTTRPDRKKRRAKEEGGEVAAIFDVDGTMLRSNVVVSYAMLRMQEMPRALRPVWMLQFLARVPYYWGLDQLSRAHFNRAFYKNYAGWTPERARRLAKGRFAEHTLEKMYPEALENLREHHRQGHRVVILSGALDFVLEPLGDLADDVLCASLKQEDGVYTGEISGPPVAGDARARMLASFARKQGIDLSRSYAYADSISDLPMMEAVGNPVAVNPDRRLAAAARGKGWEVRRWENGAGGPE
ncbi:HAD-IB family hydrolase [Rubrobacter aplysinae]|uniref:HAD-IB family hydrolase n=1 Tax=Rubrobacter aplysinae TaxID=909625 RepID=UPI00064BE1FD|nr:HAD-IB family hydrolase [Rubrobacter aplysinae]